MLPWGTGCYCRQRDTIDFRKYFDRFGDRFGACHEQDFFVGDFDDVRLSQPPVDRRFRVVKTFPQRRTQFEVQLTSRPASLAVFTASSVAERTPGSVMDNVPK